MTEEGAASAGNGDGIPGGEGQTWQEQFLAGDDFAELRDNEVIKTFPDVPSLAKSWIETKALVGRKGVIIPKKDAAPEEWDQFYSELGRPATPEVYELKLDGLPEDFPYLPEMETAFRQMAFKAGLNPAQTKIIFDDYNKFNLELFQKNHTEIKNKVAEMEAGLQKEWGGQYAENIALARTTAAKIAPAGSPELMALDKAIGESPVLVKFFYNLGKSMSEGHFIAGGTPQGTELETRRQQLMSDPAYLDEKAATHKAVVAEVTAIYNQLHPENKE